MRSFFDTIEIDVNVILKKLYSRGFFSINVHLLTGFNWPVQMILMTKDTCFRCEIIFLVEKENLLLHEMRIVQLSMTV